MSTYSILMVQRGTRGTHGKKLDTVAGHILDLAPGDRSHIRPNFWDIVNIMMESIENHDFFYVIVYLNIGISHLCSILKIVKYCFPYILY